MNNEIRPKFVEKPWGCGAIPATFGAPPNRRIGEIWFEPPAELSAILLKYLFTSEKLSIQVHPSDAQAEKRGLGSKGKHECWLVVDAAQGSSIAIGFQQEIEERELRAASLDGRIADLLHWYQVQVGDFFYIPANTVHAIGAGLTLIEIQNNSDLTYRLYDYGRGRKLHLEAAASLANLSPHPAELRGRVFNHNSATLIEGSFFRVDYVNGEPTTEAASRYRNYPVIVTPLCGTVSIGALDLTFGKCGYASDLSLIRPCKNARYLITQPQRP